MIENARLNHELFSKRLHNEFKRSLERFFVRLDSKIVGSVLLVNKKQAHCENGVLM
jgi:hypothetical protein